MNRERRMVRASITDQGARDDVLVGGAKESSIGCEQRRAEVLLFAPRPAAKACRCVLDRLQVVVDKGLPVKRHALAALEQFVGIRHRNSQAVFGIVGAALERHQPSEGSKRGIRWSK